MSKLSEQAAEEAFAKQVKKEEAIDDKYGLPTNSNARADREASRMTQVFDSYNRAKKSVEQGEKTNPAGDTYKKGGKIKAKKVAGKLATRGYGKAR